MNDEINGLGGYECVGHSSRDLASIELRPSSPDICFVVEDYLLEEALEVWRMRRDEEV